VQHSASAKPAHACGARADAEDGSGVVQAQPVDGHELDDRSLAGGQLPDQVVHLPGLAFGVDAFFEGFDVGGLEEASAADALLGSPIGGGPAVFGGHDAASDAEQPGCGRAVAAVAGG
jgi:hypothetical protein